MIWVLPVSLVSGHYYLYVIEFPQYISLKFEEVIFRESILPSCVAYICCYIYIIQNIYRRGRRIRKASMGSRRYKFERENRVTKFAGSTVLFMVCWLQLAAVGIVKARGNRIAYTSGYLIFNLALYNLAGNPLIYFWFMQNIWMKVRNCKVCQTGGCH